MGGEEADDKMDDKGSESMFHNQDNPASVEGSNGDPLEIEVAAEDFYETTAADADFVASMYAFPLSIGEVKKADSGPSWLASGDTTTRAVTPTGPTTAGPTIRKY